jgi:RNA polymerase sigma-70 factor, ECF subfamily
MLLLPDGDKSASSEHCLRKGACSLNGDGGTGFHRKPDYVLDLSRGDATDVNRLFAGYVPRLQRVAARILGNQQDSEDALQEGLLSAFRHLSQFRGDARFATWMYTIVANAAKEKLRRRRSRPPISSLDEPLSEDEHLYVSDTVADPTFALEEEYERKEKRRILEKTLQQLSPTLRSIVRMYDLEGMRMKEIASRLGLSISALKTQHFRAKRQILKIMKLGSAHQAEDEIHARARPKANANTWAAIGFEMHQRSPKFCSADCCSTQDGMEANHENDSDRFDGSRAVGSTRRRRSPREGSVTGRHPPSQIPDANFCGRNHQGTHRSVSGPLHTLRPGTGVELLY